MPLGGRIASASTSAAPTPSSPPMDVVEKVTPAAVEAVVLATQADSIVVPSSSIVAPLLSAGVVATSAPMVLPPSSTALVASPSTVLVLVMSPSSSSCPCVSLDHLYTSSDAYSLWGATYKSK